MLPFIQPLSLSTQLNSTQKQKWNWRASKAPSTPHWSHGFVWTGRNTKQNTLNSLTYWHWQTSFFLTSLSSPHPPPPAVLADWFSTIPAQCRIDSSYTSLQLHSLPFLGLLPTHPPPPILHLLNQSGDLHAPPTTPFPTHEMPSVVHVATVICSRLATVWPLWASATLSSSAARFVAPVSSYAASMTFAGVFLEPLSSLLPPTSAPLTMASLLIPVDTATPQISTLYYPLRPSRKSLFGKPATCLFSIAGLPDCLLISYLWWYWWIIWWFLLHILSDSWFATLSHFVFLIDCWGSSVMDWISKWVFCECEKNWLRFGLV